MLRAIRVEGGQPRQGGREVCAPGAPLWVDLSPGPEDLAWLGDALEGVFPNARAFVRPGLDEPDEVALLFAREGGP